MVTKTSVNVYVFMKNNQKTLIFHVPLSDCCLLSMAAAIVLNITGVFR